MDHLTPGVGWFPTCNTFGELLGGPQLLPAELSGGPQLLAAEPGGADAVPQHAGGQPPVGGAPEEWDAPRARPPPGGKIACRECGATFACVANLRNHLRIHTGERPFACEECGASFTQRSNLRSHKRVHTGERPYMCGVCGQTFSRSSHLPGHMRTHTGERPFGCPRCGRSFATNQIMKNHLRTHTGERPFSCEACGATFAQSSCLATHRKIHTGERNFGCGECGKAFISRSGLQTHERVHTGEKPYSCQRCGKSFKTSSYLSKHRQKYCGNNGHRKRAGRSGAKGPASWKGRGAAPKGGGTKRPRRSRRRRNGESEGEEVEGSPVGRVEAGADGARASRRTRRWARREEDGSQCPGDRLDGDPSNDWEAEGDPVDLDAFDGSQYLQDPPVGQAEDAGLGDAFLGSPPGVPLEPPGESQVDAHRRISGILRRVADETPGDQPDSYVPRSDSWYS